MKIRIDAPEGTCPPVTVSLEDGTELGGVIEAVHIDILPDNIVRADVRFMMPNVHVVADVTVSEDHLRELAGAHGFDLVKRSDA